MKTTAAILVETAKPLVVADIEVPTLKSGQVLVEISYSGVCHTQLLECRGHRGEDRFLPHLLGHEAGGIVHDVGPAVAKVKPGDHVILSWLKGSGANVPGCVYKWDGREVNAGAVTTFGAFSVVSENRLTVVPEDFPLTDASLLGCAVATGAGAVFNTAGPKPGQSIAIFGTGGVGLCAVNAADVAGCTPVIAVDILDAKLEIAGKMGATHFINASRDDPVEQINGICPGGVDFAVEAAGVADVMTQALLSVRSRGGIAVIVGNAPYGRSLSVDPRQLNNGKQLRGTWGGDSKPDTDFPRYAKLISAGRLNIRPLVSKKYTLERINQALDDLEAGKVARPMIDLTKG